MFRTPNGSPIQWYQDPEDGLACYSSPIRNYEYQQSDEDPNYWIAVRLKSAEEMEAELAAERRQILLSEAREAAEAKGDSCRTALYRLHDEQGQLLYIGISTKPLSRWTQHSGDKEWWPEVAALSLDWFDSTTEARAMEAHAIRSEHPTHNVIHKTAA